MACLPPRLADRLGDRGDDATASLLEAEIAQRLLEQLVLGAKPVVRLDPPDEAHQLRLCVVGDRQATADGWVRPTPPAACILMLDLVKSDEELRLGVRL